MMAIKDINNLIQIQHLARLPEGETGVVVLDFDHTCARPRHELFTHLFDQIVSQFNALVGITENAHKEWYEGVLRGTYFAKVLHKENDENVQSVIALFRQNKWQVRILTNRPEEAELLTAQHGVQAGLGIDPNEYHFRQDNSYEKGERLVQLLRPRQPVHVIFVDDDIRNCESVQKAIATRDWIKGHIFRYEPLELPKEPAQLASLLNRLIIQLYHYRRGQFTEEPYTEELLREADDALGIIRDPALFASSFVSACMITAQLDNVPFTEGCSPEPKKPRTEATPEEEKQ